MNPGIRQGFIRFGSVGHHVLLYLHEYGISLASDIKREATHSESVQISATVMRLRRHGFIFVVGRDRKPGQRSQKLYGLTLTHNSRLYVPILTPAEKQKACRARKKLKVASVFEFRGKIELGVASE